MCMVNSYPIGGSPDDDLTFANVAFKCLVGIEIKDLANSIKDFVSANWDEPYYQGQATAFALSLLSPFKAKVIAKLGQLPKYASKISDFKIIGKASNSDELLSISQVMVKLPDDLELEAAFTATKHLPGPTLPLKIAKTFENSTYYNRRLLLPERFFKYHGVDNRTGKKYTWVVKKKYPTEQELRVKLAILPAWKVDIKYVTEFEVPAGTWISEGSAASQAIGYPGGDYQAVILNVPKTWILTTANAFTQ